MNTRTIIRQGSTLLLAALCAVAMVSCSEEIDTSNRYTFTDETVLSYLEKHEQYSQYVSLLYQVPVSDVSESSVAQLLSARGHYTCFAPTNDAIQLYLDTLFRKGIISEPSWEGFHSEATTDSIRRVIVYNSIIDGGDFQTYDIASFPKNSNDEFSIANMNDRKLSVVYGTVNTDSIYINDEAPVSLVNRDIETINGRVHEVSLVIAPSNDTMFDMVERWSQDATSGYMVMAKLLLACGLGDTLTAVRDEVWEHLYQTKAVADLPAHSSFGQVGSMPAHRKYGFTIFAETDATWARVLNKPATEITVADVMGYLEERISLFEETGITTDDNYTDRRNLLNLFVTYHVLPERISRDKLVVHYNEKGYDYANSLQYTIAISDFYTTMGEPRLIKVYESRESNGIYLNRFPILRNGRGDYSPEKLNKNDYHESGTFQRLRGNYYVDATQPEYNDNWGVEVLKPSDVNVTSESPVNGIVYPINRLLFCTQNTRIQMQNQRIRIDASTMFPEFMSNDLRGIKQYYTEGASNCRGIPSSYPYLADVDIKEGTNFYYLPGLNQGWCNMEADEFNVIGHYEFTMKLPPVPRAGHYELRFGVATGSYVRGMCQVYWGKDKQNLPAVGIPMDLRVGGKFRRLPPNIQQPSTVGWEEDTDDQETNDEIDKKMRNNGFMKAPESWTARLGTSETVRGYEYITRRILVSADMEPNTSYYIKFKSVLEDTKKEFFMDYIEYCAKEVYDNPEEAEDIW